MSLRTKRIPLAPYELPLRRSDDLANEGHVPSVASERARRGAVDAVPGERRVDDEDHEAAATERAITSRAGLDPTRAW